MNLYKQSNICTELRISQWYTEQRGQTQTRFWRQNKNHPFLEAESLHACLFLWLAGGKSISLIFLVDSYYRVGAACFGPLLNISFQYSVGQSLVQHCYTGENKNVTFFQIQKPKSRSKFLRRKGQCKVNCKQGPTQSMNDIFWPFCYFMHFTPTPARISCLVLKMLSL